ncbi:MAG: DNA-binding response regulator [Alistipes sp.]
MYKILIVSEDDFLGNLILFSLCDIKAEVSYTSDFAKMKAVCHRGGVDLLILLAANPFLCDKGMISEVRPHGLRRPAIHVISWQQSEFFILSLLEQGVDQYMTFPLSLQRLRGKILGELRGGL